MQRKEGFMKTKDRKYRALISSDWNECLSPSRPFDVISFSYPSLALEVEEVFKAYTGNRIPLSEAARRIADLLPQPITEEQMDAYLDGRFATYRGVPELIGWCRRNDILFMINTTGMKGYFQRVFQRGLMPKAPVISAHPMITYHDGEEASCQWYDLLEIQDKPKNTRSVVHAHGIPPDKVVLIGDSGGDGPHFEWGARAGACLIGSMTKGSLERYCRERGIEIHRYFGCRYAEGEERDPKAEMEADFMDLTPEIEKIL